MQNRNVDLNQAGSFYQSLASALQASNASGGTPPTLSFTWNGKTQELQLTPELLQGIQTGVGAGVLGRGSDIGRDISFSKTDIASALHVKENAIDGLVSTGAKAGQAATADGQFRFEDVMPWIATNASMLTENRVS